MDHIAPATIHDSFCRCRACKPPLVGEQSSRAMRIRIILALAILLWLGIIAIAH